MSRTELLTCRIRLCSHGVGVLLTVGGGGGGGGRGGGH